MSEALTINDVRLVPGEPRIEQVAQRFGPKFDLKLKNYEVFIGDVLIGRVEQHLPTFERKPEGSRIVTSRWKTAHPRWIYTSPFEKRDGFFSRNRYRDYYETRQRCLEELVRHYNEREDV
jgi:hypothetical protein